VNLPVYKAKDEITELSNSFSLMQEELKQYIENLQLTTSAKEKMEGEIGVARTIQLGMLPKTFPKRSDCDISAVLEPARGIGGDLYDFLFTADNKLYFAIGDVSGKGVPAALFMAITRTLFRAGIEKGKPIHHLVADLNNELCRENPNQMFVTFIVGLFDLFTGELNLCNAGHNPPVIIRKNGEIEKLPQRDGLPLGIFEQSVYTFSTIKLNKGEYFIAYTDGITDALNEKEELYGEERLFQYLTHTHRKTSNEIIEGTLEDVRAFTGGGDPFDDITMLVVKYLEVSFTEDTDPKQITDTVSIRLLNQVSEITTLSQWLELASERWNLSPKQAYTVNIVLEELISNIIFYGYEDQEEHSIDVEISKSGTTLTIITIDEGKPFNILEQAVPVDTLSTAEDRSIGGLGIHLVRTLMDHVEYRRESEKNIVVLTKELNP
jgi:sigma-B regulation protein RsbU (phosphoserine phosphatase)